MKLFSKNSNVCDHDTSTSRADRQTDGQTDRQRDRRLAVSILCVASRGKNYKVHSFAQNSQRVGYNLPENRQNLKAKVAHWSTSNGLGISSAAPKLPAFVVCYVDNYELEVSSLGKQGPR